MTLEKQHRNVLVLSATQSTLQITGVTMTAVTGLAGFALADDKSFATVPLTCYVFGSAITTIPASFLMKSDRPPRGISDRHLDRHAGRRGLQPCGLSRQLLAVVRRHGGDGHLYRVRQILSLCRRRCRQHIVQGEGDLVYAGRRHPGRHHRSRNGEAHQGPLRRSRLHGRVPVVDRRLHAGDAGAHAPRHSQTVGARAKGPRPPARPPSCASRCSWSRCWPPCCPTAS